MGPEAWKRAIGAEAWNHIVRQDYEAGDQGEVDTHSGHNVARILTAAAEAGFRAPEQAPRVSPEGTRVMWPGSPPVLTAAGLAKEWALRGHGFLILRADQLAKAVAGPLLPRLQEVMAAYEEQCAEEGIEALAVDWRGFVGGKAPTGAWVSADHVFLRTLAVMCPEPVAGGFRSVTRSGPGGATK